MAAGGYWDPARIAQNDVVTDGSIAAQAVRSTARMCIHAWASRYSRILQMLSGGLDSSIIAGCLKYAPSQPAVTCLNFRNARDLSSDERGFARLAAEHAGYELLERELDSNFSFEGRLRVPLTASPINNYYQLAPDNLAMRVAHETGAQALFSGEGGDQLFYQNDARLAYCDFLRAHGPRWAMLRMALDAAQMEGDTLWRVLKRNPFRAPLDEIVQAIASHVLLTVEARKSVSERLLFLPPWLKGRDGMSPGKWWHILCVSSALSEDMYSPFTSASSPENVAPLVSQPLIELCLRIPTFVLIAGGRDRALARRAFRADVPAQILARRSKGVTYDSAKVLLTRNLELVRNVLLNGALVRERILDRGILEDVLSGRAGTVPAHSTQVLTYVMSEIWLGAWAGRRAKAAA